MHWALGLVAQPGKPSHRHLCNTSAPHSMAPHGCSVTIDDSDDLDRVYLLALEWTGECLNIMPDVAYGVIGVELVPMCHAALWVIRTWFSRMVHTA